MNKILYFIIFYVFSTKKIIYERNLISNKKLNEKNGIDNNLTKNKILQIKLKKNYNNMDNKNKSKIINNKKQNESINLKENNLNSNKKNLNKKNNLSSDQNFKNIIDWKILVIVITCLAFIILLVIYIILLISKKKVMSIFN